MVIGDTVVDDDRRTRQAKMQFNVASWRQLGALQSTNSCGYPAEKGRGVCDLTRDPDGKVLSDSKRSVEAVKMALENSFAHG